MSGREDADLTGLYLDFASQAYSPRGIDDSVVTLDKWPAEFGGAVTLGFENHTEHDVPGRVVIAARVAELATATALGRRGAQEMWGTANPALLARTKTFETILRDCFSKERGAGDPTGFALVVEFASNATPHFRRGTVDATDLKAFHGASGEVVGVGAIEAIDDLVIRSEVSRIRLECAQAVRSVLRRDFGVVPAPDAEEALSRWAVIKRMPALSPSSAPGQVAYGHFMRSCYEIRNRLIGTEDEKEQFLAAKIGGAAYGDYRHLQEMGVGAIPARTVNFPKFRVSELEQRERTADDARRVIAERPEFAGSRGRTKPNTRTFHTRDTDSLGALAGMLAVPAAPSLTELRRRGATAVSAQLLDCREGAAARADETARRQEVRACLGKLCGDYPYLHPTAVRQLDAGELRHEQLALHPDHAASYLGGYNATYLGGNREATSTTDWLSAFAAASMGAEPARREASSAVNVVRRRLQQHVLDLIPVINSNGLREVPDMQQRYGTNPDEVERLGIVMPQPTSQLPIHLYTAAALSVIERSNPDNLFPVMLRQEPVLPKRIQDRLSFIYRPYRSPNADAIHGQLDHIAEHLYDEASSHFVTDVYQRDAQDRLRRGPGSEVLQDRVYGNLLVLSRLAEIHHQVAVEQPGYQEIVAARLGPLIAQADRDAVNRLPREARKYLAYYLRAYRELSTAA